MSDVFTGNAGSPEMFSAEEEPEEIIPGIEDATKKKPAPEPEPEEAPEPETPAEVPAEVPEPESPVAPAEAPSEPTEEGPTPTGSPAVPQAVDYKKRYDDLRTSYNERINTERRAREFAEQQLAQALASPQKMAPAALSEDQLKLLADKAQEAGLDEQQAVFFAELAQQQGVAQAEAAYRAMLEQNVANARINETQAREKAAAQATEDAKAQFIQAHPDLSSDQSRGMVSFLVDVGVLEALDYDAVGQPVQTVPAPDSEGIRILAPEALEIAFEALQNPGLRNVLIAQPTLYETNEGIDLARRLAGMTAPTPNGNGIAEASAAVAAAQTLRAGPSGLQPPKDDVMAELEQLAASGKGNVFTG